MATLLPLTSTPIAALGPAALHDAVLRTVLYADVFDYALTLAEMQHYLIGVRASPEAVRAALESGELATRLVCRDGYCALQERTHLIPLRLARRQHATRLWRQARAWATWISAAPFVRMAAITGALAVDNAPPGDDIDLLIVTAPGRVWLARAACVALVRLARVFGARLCPNYVLSAAALEQDTRSLYIAHDLAQMVPLAGHDVYAAMRAANAWALTYLPQARSPLKAEADRAPRGFRRAMQRLGEWILRGKLGDALESFERRRKQRKFAAAASASRAARLDADHVKGHFHDHGSRILGAYRARLEQAGLWPEDGETPR